MTGIALLDGFGPHDPLVWPAASDARPPLSASEFCGAVHALSRELPRAPFAINRCEDPARFLLGTAAVLAAGQTLILPPARGSAAHAELRARYPNAYVLADGPLDDAGEVRVVPDCLAPPRALRWPPPSIGAAHTAAILFTSGSTGAPQPHAKSWSAFVRGAGTFVEAFGPIAREAVIVGTVAPQHMFGFESTVMAPWRSGVPVCAARPLYPADLGALADALTAQRRRMWLMTTPLHLRAFHGALRPPPRIERIIASTMPLAIDLAGSVERDWSVPVHEIYGCTEGGMLAVRRPAQEARFACAGRITCALDDDGAAIFQGGQLDAPLRVGDRFVRHHDASHLLELVGRSRDLVKIAGKRSTLSALGAALQSIPGVLDGAFILPDTDAARVGAVVVAPAHDAVSLRRALAQRIDRAFLPRPLAFAAALPRDAQGKLSLAAACELLRADPASRPDRRLIRSCAIPATHPSLEGHFPGRPLVPGVVLLEGVERLLRDHGIAICAVSEASFARAVAPDEALTMNIDIEPQRARFRIDAQGSRAVSGVLSWRRAAG